MQREFILLGAGASIEAGFADSCGLLTELISALRKAYDEQKSLGQHYPLAHHLHQLLTEHEKGRPGNTRESPNIEQFFAFLESLARVNDTALGPVISKLTDGMANYGLDVSLGAIEDRWGFPIWSTHHPSTLPHSEAVHLKIETLVLIHHYFNAKDMELLKRAQYLLPLINFARENEAHIATLNYDTSLEFVADVYEQFSFSRGVQDGQYPNITTWGAEGPELIKLHGSVDWYFKYGKLHVGDEAPSGPPFTPCLLFGAGNKLTATGPYLSLYQRFLHRLDQSDLLTVIGYSFSDEHINEAIYHWLSASKSKHIRIANGQNFFEADLPNRHFAGLYDPGLRGTSTIEGLNASEAIKKWYGQTLAPEV